MKSLNRTLTNNCSSDEIVRSNKAARLKIDHIYLIANKHAPEFRFLKEEGFYIADIISRQPEFGLSGRFLYFQNFFIKLHWIEDENVFVKNFLPADKKFNQDPDKIKTGIALINRNIINTALPFKTQNYHFEWMNPGSCVKAAEIENTFSPLYFILPNYMAYNKDQMRKVFTKPLMQHKNGIRKLTKLKLFYENRDLTAAEKYLAQKGIIDYQSGKTNYIELEFDNNMQGKDLNLKEELSIIIKY